MNNYPGCRQDEDPFTEPQTFERDAITLAHAVLEYARKVRISDATKEDLYQLEMRADEVLVWLDQNESASSMGWVDHRGRP